MSARKKSVEVDVHVWAKPETRNMVATYTLSVGKYCICYDFPKDQAAAKFLNYLEELEEE